MYKSLEITPLNGNIVEVPVLDKSVVDTANVQGAIQPTVTQPTVTNNGHPPKVRIPMGKNKFKPNLNFDRRSRNVSGGNRPTVSALPRTGLPNGSPLPRARTVSGSSTSSEPEIAPPHPRQSLSPSPGLARTGASPIPAMSPKPATVFDVVTNPVKELPNTLGNADEESDWEDDQFTYKSVEVNENDEMYKSLEITPLNGNIVEVP